MNKKAAVSPPSSLHAPHGLFPTTNWSNIGRLDSPDFARALSELCQQYWYPVYAFIRRRSSDAHQAEDLTQAFFEKMLTQQTFRLADPDKGRFRAFLLTSVRNFVASDYASQQTLRRGGGHRVIPIDTVQAEQLYHRNRSNGASPEDDFDRAWALALIERALDRLRLEFSKNQQSTRFELLVPCLRSEPVDFEAVAVTLGIDPAAARKAASRCRQRYGQILRDEIASTLSEHGDLELEIAWVIRLFSR